MTRLQIWLCSIGMTMLTAAAFWGVWSAFLGGIPVQEVVLWKTGAEGQEVTTFLTIFRTWDILAFGIFPFFGLPLFWCLRDRNQTADLTTGLTVGLIAGGLTVGLIVGGLFDGLFDGLTTVLTVGLLAGLFLGLTTGLTVGLIFCLSMGSGLSVALALSFGGVVGGGVLLPSFLIALCVYGAVVVYRNHISAKPNLSISRREAA